MTVPSIVRRYLEANGLRFHIAAAGKPGRPLVLLLHGFPECWYSWRYQLRALAEAGFYAVAPDLRGYNLTEKPALGYDLDDLAADVVAIAQALGYDRCSVAGHDWGGLIAWWTAACHPAAIDRLVALNIPPLAALHRDLRRPDQALRSAYALFFRLPLLPEWLLSWNDYALLVAAFRGAAMQKQVFTEEVLAVFREAIAQPGAIFSALGYYRAVFPRLQRGEVLADQRIEQPSLLLWGIGDPFAGVHLTSGIEQWAPKAQVKYLASCGHWTQQEQPERVSRAMLSFLGE